MPAAVIAVAGAAAVLLLNHRFSIDARGGRSLVELAMAGFALGSAWWLGVKFKRERRLWNLLTVAALAALATQNLAYFALPAITGSGGDRVVTTAQEAVWPLIAALFAAAAFTPWRLVVTQGREWLAAGAVLGVSLLLTVLIDLRFASSWTGPSSLHGGWVAVAIVFLVVPAFGFIRSALRKRDVAIASALAGASILIAASWWYDLLGPSASARSLSGRDCLRLLAYGLIVVVALRARTRVRKTAREQLAADERRRLARDLHDGMAQDLAFIAVHGDDLRDKLGVEHPLVVAARHALASCRNAIVDLSASASRTTADALRAVAAEVSRRHGVQIIVEAPEEDDLSPEDREEVVRIARQAMVNAVEHGGADTVVAHLTAEGHHLALSVADDGRGMDPRASSAGELGHGLRMMHERAATLGGRLTVQQRPGGGTNVRLVA